MPNFRKLGKFTTSPVMKQLDAHPELWDSIPLRRTSPGTPHGSMTDIWVRYNDVRPFEAAGDYRGLNEPHIPIWYPAWSVLTALRPILFGLMRAVEGEMLGGVLITRLPPGKGIDKHVDSGWHVGYYDKFYVSLKSAPGTRFCWDEGAIEPTTGDVWWFNNTVPHWVENNSTEERIALIAAIRTDHFRS